ncbi:NDR1/HIN1-like protein 2 [Andrographis paniculata]|uniref:NDR1/HIN1-like protein 2 n=1 Tax=Andrographis paniculata TaxID=175694 RepID=UPI0021E8C651|nr:NDR1/HIN1-like protein 2 [Andrographis paniculata]
MAAYQFAGDFAAPPSKHRNKGGDRLCSCGIFRCCFGCCWRIFRCGLGCLCNLVCQIICAVLVIAAIAMLIVWLLFRPSNLEFRAGEASLTEFSLAGNTVRYNLALNVSARNPNSRLEIIYEDIEAVGYYHGQEFASDRLPAFSQEKETTRTITAEFEGQKDVSLGDEARANYEEEKSSGEFPIDVKVQLKIKLKVWLLTSPFSLKPSFDCDLNVPLNSSGKSYQGTDCTFDWRNIDLH